MASLADALEVLLKHSSVPHESEDRDVVQAVIDRQRNATTKAAKTTKEGEE